MKHPTFKEAYAVVQHHTLLTEKRCRALWLMAGVTAGIQGDVLELGTFRGGSLYLLAAACPTRRVYGVDTFAGMPAKESPGVDYHKAGDFKETSLERVRALVAPFPNATPVRMTFPEGLAQHPIDGPFSLAHFDGDLLRCCLAFLDHVLPRLSPGGAIVFDDYDMGTCRGVRMAIEERDLEVVYAFANQAVYVKGGR
jgi:O-methyltransferase